MNEKTPCEASTRRGRYALGAVSGAIVLCAFLGGPVASQELEGFRRGDCNGDISRNISDVSHLLTHLFGNPVIIPCDDACDADDDGTLALIDAVFLLSVIFDDLPIPEPAICGGDPTGDSLACDGGPCSDGSADELWAHTLPTGRRQLPYAAQLPLRYQDEVTWETPSGTEIVVPEIAFVEYGLLSSSRLPTGLTFDPATGVVAGNLLETGLHELDFWARTADGITALLECQLALFSATESEWLPGQPLSAPGPHPVATLETAFPFTHVLPWPVPLPLYACNPVQPPQLEWTLDKELIVHYPADADEALPLLIFHHGAGYNGDDYEVLLTHLASHGNVCVSVNDPFPFFTIAAFYCWGGHDEAARVLLATRALIEALGDEPGHPLEGLVAGSAVFYGGHSRGGSAAIIASELDRRTRGVIALQPTDAKGDSFIGNTNRWEHFPDVPLLVVSAEQDTDVTFPYAERLLERATGPTTFVTVFGGCHGFTTDTETGGCGFCSWSANPPFVDQCPYIARALQHNLIERFATALLKRHGLGDLSVEGLLYGPEHQASDRLSVVYDRRLAGSLLIDDFATYPINALGGTINTLGMLGVGSGSCYDTPDPAPAPVTAIDNLVMELPFQGLAELRMPLESGATPLDAGTRQRLLFRLKNHDFYGLVDNFGLSWLDVSLTLVDADGNSSTVELADYWPTAPFHPEPQPPGLAIPLKLQRFFTLAVPLADFQQPAPSIDIHALTELRWRWLTDGTQNVFPLLGLDDVRLE